MNANAPSASELADELLARAEGYARDALGVLAQDYPELRAEVPDEVCELMRLRLQTQFLFAQLPDWQLGLLAALYWQRQTLTRLVSFPQGKLPASLQTQAERVTGQMEQSFMNMVRKLKDLIRYESLPATLRIIFDQEYARISFTDRSG
jgi:hypothetical protein